MREEFKIIEDSVEHFKKYLNTRIAQIKLGAAEKTSDILSVLIAKLLVAAVFFFFILFASIAAACVLGRLLGEIWQGFLVVSAFYLLLGVVIWAARDRMLRIPIMNRIIRRLFNDQLPTYEKN
jgi:hypothetical protein